MAMMLIKSNVVQQLEISSWCGINFEVNTTFAKNVATLYSSNIRKRMNIAELIPSPESITDHNAKQILLDFLIGSGGTNADSFKFQVIGNLFKINIANNDHDYARQLITALKDFLLAQEINPAVNEFDGFLKTKDIELQPLKKN